MNQDDQNKQMRGADIVIGIIFLILGILILIGSFQMPLKDSYGGVESAWYVSPALMPIIIGIVMILLAATIVSFGFKQGGLELLKENRIIRKSQPFFNEDTVRFLAVLVPLVGLVYFDLRMLDFCIAVALYLSFTIGVFHFEKPEVLTNTLKLYSLLMFINLIFRVFNLNVMLDSLFLWTTDLIGIAELVVLLVYMKKQVKAQADYESNLKHRYNQMIRVSLITPLVIAVIFRFALRVPMPKEGFIMNFMYLIYYAVR
jgi:hypothetical protein